MCVCWRDFWLLIWALWCAPAFISFLSLLGRSCCLTWQPAVGCVGKSGAVMKIYFFFYLQVKSNHNFQSGATDLLSAPLLFLWPKWSVCYFLPFIFIVFCCTGFFPTSLKETDWAAVFISCSTGPEMYTNTNSNWILILFGPERTCKTMWLHFLSPSCILYAQLWSHGLWMYEYFLQRSDVYVNGPRRTCRNTKFAV